MSADDSYRTIRLVLKRRHWEDAGEFAAERGWSAQPVVDTGTGRLSWLWDVDETTTFQVTRDADSGEFCCFFYGPDPELLEDLLEAAKERLDLWDLAELLAAPYEEPDARRLVQCIFRLGLGAPRVFTPEFMPPMVHAMAQENAMVRAAAARTTTYMEWPEFFPILETMAENDADERIRAEAAKIAGVYRQVGIAGA